MMDSDMSIARALGVFHDINNPEISDHEKAVAIYVVTQKQRRLNEVKKEAMVDVIRWLWRRVFRVRKETPDENKPAPEAGD